MLTACGRCLVYFYSKFMAQRPVLKYLTWVVSQANIKNLIHTYSSRKDPCNPTFMIQMLSPNKMMSPFLTSVACCTWRKMYLRTNKQTNHHTVLGITGQWCNKVYKLTPPVEEQRLRLGAGSALGCNNHLVLERFQSSVELYIRNRLWNMLISGTLHLYCW